MVDAGELDPTDEGLVEPPNWSLTIAMAAVIVVALLAGAVALADSVPADSLRRYESAAAPSVLGSVTVRTSEAPATAAPPTGSPSTAPPTTAPTTGSPTTGAPSTVAPTTGVPATSAPATTVSPTPPTTAGPAAWLAVDAGDVGFAAEFPAAPVITVPQVRGPDGVVGRTEYNVDGPGGSRISVTTIPADRGSQPVESYLAAVADQARRDVGGSLSLGEPGTVSGAPARPFTVTVPGGRIRAEVVYANSRLYTVSMFAPGTATGTPADAAFDRLLGSFRLT